MDILRLKPASKNVTVRDPRTGRALAARGEDKPRTTYWLRRLRDGDVIDMDAKPAAVISASKGPNTGGKSS